jgi:hypothetical protein
MGTICIKDTCLQIQLAAAQNLRTQFLGSSLTARYLRDDRQTGNKQYTQNASNRIENRPTSTI